MSHSPSREANLNGPLFEGVLYCAERNNADETAAVNAAFGSGRKLRIDRALCDLYLRVGPTTGRGIAYAVVSGATPMDLVRSGEQTVAELDPVLRDLVRRRVIHV